MDDMGTAGLTPVIGSRESIMRACLDADNNWKIDMAPIVVDNVVSSVEEAEELVFANSVGIVVDKSEFVSLPNTTFAIQILRASNKIAAATRRATANKVFMNTQTYDEMLSESPYLIPSLAPEWSGRWIKTAIFNRSIGIWVSDSAAPDKVYVMLCENFDANARLVEIDGILRFGFVSDEAGYCASQEYVRCITITNSETASL
jgi:hypothetical protein